MIQATAQSVPRVIFARLALTSGRVFQELIIQVLEEDSCGTLVPCARLVLLALNMVKRQEQLMHAARATTVL
jgi:hypothetical protein